MRRLYGFVLIMAFLMLSLPVYSEALRYSRVYLFDFDGDRSLEVVTNIGVVKGGVLAPFARSFDVYRFDCGGFQCILFVDGVRGYVYSQGRLEYSLTVTRPLTVSNYPYNVLSVGDRLYYGGSILTTSLKPSGAVYGFIYGGRLAAAYVDSGSGYTIVDIPGYTFYVIPLSIAGEVIGVGYSEGLVYILFKTDFGSVLLEWSPTGTLRINSSTIKLYEVLAFSRGVFIANGDRGVYVVSMLGANLAVEGGRVIKVGVGGEILVVKGSKLFISKFDGLALDVIMSLDFKTVIIDADYASQTLTYTDGLGVEIVSFKEIRKVELSMPSNAIAGEPLDIRVVGDFVRALVKLPDGRIYNLTPASPKISWTPISAGVFAVTALIETQAESITLTRLIEVSPRPSRIFIIAPDKVKPYSNVTIRLELSDGLTGKPRTDVIGFCTLKVSGLEYPATLWTPVIIQAIPVGVEVPIEVSCNLPPPYYRAEASKSIPVAEAYVGVEFKYRGGGVFTVEARNIYTNKPVEGILKISIGEARQEIVVPGALALAAPGVYDVNYEFYSPQRVLLVRGLQKLVWYGSVEEAPRTAVLEVADVLVTVTAVGTETREVPLLVTETVRAVDPIISFLSFIAGIALMLIPVTYFILRARRVEAEV